MQQQQDIRITYETLFELLRREKSREEIQELEPDFLKNVDIYLQEKMSILKSSFTKTDIFASTERNKTEHQLANVAKILRELYDRRERKVINIAMSKVKTGSTVFNSKGLIPQEQDLFSDLTLLLGKYRENVLGKLLNTNKPAPPPPPPKPKKITEKVKFLVDVAQFVGKNLETIGPYKKGEVAELAPEIAKVLVESKRGEKVI